MSNASFDKLNRPSVAPSAGAPFHLNHSKRIPCIRRGEYGKRSQGPATVALGVARCVIRPVGAVLIITLTYRNTLLEPLFSLIQYSAGNPAAGRWEALTDEAVERMRQQGVPK
jgi:hypothetical protein